jgi:mRNA interferase MazF
MQPMTTYDFGDVILVPFPFTDQSTIKKRPAIVISSEDYNRCKPDLILIAVTSNVRKDLQFGEVFIDEWSAAGLIKPSIVKPIITTTENSLVIKKLGILQPLDLQALENILQLITGRTRILGLEDGQD